MLMKAVICPAYGPPEILRIAEVEKPIPKDNEVLVKIRATTVTVADVRIRAFRVPKSFWIPGRLALGITKPNNAILGVEFAGVVEEVGKDVRSIKTGDEVFGSTLSKMGGYAEYKCVSEKLVTTKPSNLSFEESAAIPVGALTALHFLKLAGVEPGKSVLIYGASGSVGSYAVQLAVHFGAKVTGVCSDANAALVKSLGAETVVDYKKENFASKLAEYDIVIDAVDYLSFDVGIKLVKDGGIYMNVTQPFKSLAMMLTRNKKVIVGQSPPWDTALLAQMRDLAEAGKIKPVIDRTYLMNEIVEAHRYVDQGHKKGNVAIRVA
jgi:NADPH:quinone reductase-like Zn-dependent oxidoreductase